MEMAKYGEHALDGAPLRIDECEELDPWITDRWDAGHPYRYRVWVRRHLPWWLINLGVADKG